MRMPSPVKTYQSEMHDNLGFYATWLPGDLIEIGDAGIIVDGRFRRQTTLSDLGIMFEVSPAGAAQDVRYTSKQGTKLTANASADAAGVARTEIKIDFTADGAFVFHASGVRVQRLQHLADIGRQVLDAYEQGHWEKSWILVEALYAADHATILVSQDSSAGLTLAAKIDTPVPELSLANPKADLGVVASRGQLIQVVGGRNLHPLFMGFRVKSSLFGSASFAPARGRGSSAEIFERPSIEELLAL
jgi:hypothetical protein